MDGHHATWICLFAVAIVLAGIILGLIARRDSETAAPTDPPLR